MVTLSTTVEYGGYPVKVQKGKVYLRAFGTTIHNPKMHWSWTEVPIDKLKKDLKNKLQEQGLI